MVIQQGQYPGATPAQLAYASSKRLPWPDFARGICVILVVAMHIYEVHYTAWLSEAPASRAWDIVVSVAQPIRMPLFFLISGYLCATSICRPWKEVVRKRVVSIAYLYYVWLGIYAITSLAETSARGTSFIPESFLRQVFWPGTSLWYLYGLVLYFLIARITSRVPLWMVLLTATLISVAGTTFLEGTTQYISRSLVFFIIGCRWPEIVRKFTTHARWLTAIIAGIAYATTCILALWAGQKTLGVLMATSLVGIYMALQISTLIAHRRPGQPIQFLGQNTLAIFVLHPIILKALNLLFEKAPKIQEWILGTPLVATFYPLIATTGVVLLCLLIEKTSRLCHGNFLFQMPVRLGPR